ncbi:tripartite tricarboxylate transporter substrate binding protein [Pseudorhodoferax sp. Leaf274]|uniref:tripartite tricarboxylate transporter substrate binding protein n=1 Tax=Pseudorhodoferax sp. Leaf274 TaxID=1736318 RepID=UPI000703038B|nr:tripartite tricarboxylate transporter substrate binding protein [Pseudorhodoferax sp. Leaf274]KQP37144.1 MFS transporter [Pseudorhodoferax sp. Leaf274]
MAHPTRRRIVLATSALAALPAFAQGAGYPNRPVKFTVPFPAGGPVDVTARAMAQKLGELWGQPGIVDNRAGAGGIVGAEIAAKQPADGYNLFVCAIHHSVLPALRPGLTYDIEKDFVPVSFGAMFPIILVAHPSLPAKNVAELVALAKKEPSKIAFSSSGNGGGTHLAGELFNMQAGVQLQHIPYKGSAPAMTDLLGGQVQLMFADAPTALPQIRAGKVRALGVASAQRSALLPELPTIAASGVPGYEAYSWAGLVAPKGTPPDIVAKISADLQKVMTQPDVKQRLFDAGAEAMPTTPEKFAQMLRSEIEKWGKVVKTANIKMD